MANKVYLTLFILVSAFLANDALACTCAEEPSPCIAAKNSVVFVAQVLSMNETIAETVILGETRKIRTSLTANVVVEEKLNGIDVDEVQIETDGDGGGCGYDFVPGERYLVYADGNPGRGFVGTSICTRTRPIEDAADDVALLRAMKNRTRETRLYGKVTEFVRHLTQNPNTVDWPRGGMGGVQIEAVSSAGSYRMTTDGDGRFSFKNLPDGEYRVRPVLSNTHSSLFRLSERRSQGPIETMVIAWPDRCGDDAQFWVQLDGHIGGQLLNSNGKPFRKRDVAVSLITADSAGKAAPEMKRRVDFTDKDGAYLFDGLPPGDYLLGLALSESPTQDTPYASTYFPGVPNPSQAITLRLGHGQKIQKVNMPVPAPLKRYPIAGVVFHKGGRPARNVSISLYDQMNPNNEVSTGRGVAKTDDGGRFSIPALAGRQYKIHAFLPQDYLRGTGTQSTLVPVDTNIPIPALVITLSEDGIFSPEILRRRP